MRCRRLFVSSKVTLAGAADAAACGAAADSGRSRSRSRRRRRVGGARPRRGGGGFTTGGSGAFGASHRRDRGGGRLRSLRGLLLLRRRRRLPEGVRGDEGTRQGGGEERRASHGASRGISRPPRKPHFSSSDAGYAPSSSLRAPLPHPPLAEDPDELRVQVPVLDAVLEDVDAPAPPGSPSCRGGRSL